MFTFKMPCLSRYTFYEDGRVYSKWYKKFLKQYINKRIKSPCYELTLDGSLKREIVYIDEIITYGETQKARTRNHAGKVYEA